MTDESKTTPSPASGPLPDGLAASAGEDEFAGIPSSYGRHPVIAVGTAALACFLIFQIKDDLRYALSPAVVQDLGYLDEETHLRLDGLRDRASAAVFALQRRIRPARDRAARTTL